MKRYIIAWISLLCCILLNAQATKQIVLTFNEDDFIFTNGNNGVTIASVVHPTTFSNDTTTPALPIIPVNIYIDDSYEFKNLSYTLIDTLLHDNIIIQNNRPPITTDNDTVYYDMTNNDNTDVYHEYIIKYTGTSVINGHKIISFHICPFKYDDLNNQLHFINELSLNISFNDINVPAIKKPVKRMNHIVKRMVVNKENFEPITDPIIYYEYLIITNNLLKESYQKLADWKSLKGIRAKVLTIEEIDSLYSDNSIQDKIKRAIQNYYNGEYGGLKYVLLGGDENVIPVHLTCVNIHGYNNNTVSDLFYACLDNLGWTNNVNVGSENINNNIDITADVVVSRLCTDSKYNTDVLVNRIIKYESAPDTTYWEDKILMTGVIDTINLYKQGEFTYNNYIAPYWHGTQTRLYDNFTDFHGCENYDVTPGNMIKELDKGYTFANWDFHGDSISLILENNLNFYYYDANMVNNKKNTIILTSACSTNAFNKTPVGLSENFMKSVKSGILGYIGSSVEGFAGPSFFFNQLLIESLLKSDNQQLGDAFFYAKSIFSYMWDKTTNARNTYRWLYYSINFLGDPEMPIYLSCPKEFNNVNISYNNGILSISTGVDSCKICISSTQRDGYYNLRENVSSWNLTGLDSSYYICITKPGYIPYVAKVADTVYIQNQTFTDDYDIYSDKTFIGKDVTDEQPHGDVVIERGKTTITHNNGVTIKNGFTVKNGAEFKITKN